MHWLEEYLGPARMRRTVIASSFTASLELAREGHIELRQEDAFRPNLHAPPRLMFSGWNYGTSTHEH